MNKLGSRIRQLRKLKGFTLEELGEKAGVCCKYIGEIERGEKTPTVTVLQKVASALGISAGFLLNSLEMEEKRLDSLASITGILYKRDAETLKKINEVLKMIFEEKS